MTQEEAKKLAADPKWQAWVAGEELEIQRLDDPNKWMSALHLSPSDFLMYGDRLRIKPKPLEAWVIADKDCIYTRAYRSREAALRDTGKSDVLRVVHMREVPNP